MKIAELLAETYKNLFNDGSKRQYASEVFHMIQASYAKIGGIQGSGFRSPDDMIANIPFWKLVVRNKEVVAVALYKDKGGRKRVAVATNGTEEGKKELTRIYQDDFDRAYFEVSGLSLGLIAKTVGVEFVKKYIKTVDEAKAISGEELLPPSEKAMMEKFPQLVPFMYDRKIGDELHTKVMLGTNGKKIVIDL